jgi:hypothetical protein
MTRTHDANNSLKTKKIIQNSININVWNCHGDCCGDRRITDNT